MTIFRSTLFSFLILAGTLVPPFAMGQEKSLSHEPHRDDPARNIEMSFKQIALEEQRSRLSFENEMRKLQLEQKRVELERERRSLRDDEHPPRGPGGPGCGRSACKPFLLLLIIGCLVVHLLMAFWVYDDIQKRKTGSRLWIVVALLTGLWGMLVYAIVRIGDKQA